MAYKETLTWTDGRGKEHCVKLNFTLDIRDYDETPGFALLALAANRDLPISKLMEWLDSLGEERSKNYYSRRRWLFKTYGERHPSGTRPNADGKDKWAVSIMEENTKLSLRDLSKLLAKSGIKRSREWIRQHRCERAAVLDN